MIAKQKYPMFNNSGEDFKEYCPLANKMTIGVFPHGPYAVTEHLSNCLIPDVLLHVSICLYTVKLLLLL